MTDRERRRLTAISDLIGAAQDARSRGELFHQREGMVDKAVILLPYSVWKRLCASCAELDAIREEGAK